MTSRIRQGLMPALFALILLNLAGSAFFTVYWLKDNQWALDPRDLGVQWLSDADYQAIQTSTASNYATSDGKTIVLTSDPDDRKKLLASYQLGTPDGRWHGRASTKLAGHTMRIWLGVALPIFVICLVGLVASRPRLKKPSAADLEREPFARVS